MHLWQVAAWYRIKLNFKTFRLILCFEADSTGASCAFKCIALHDMDLWGD